ncbi:glycosyltransferase family 4 protein [Thermoleophilum album]|uniref:Glycosyl transferase 4-like domain-containing protein n=1 Tax=Thermoleophilum album TaxID=29539 RepID=A0A1H6FN78_THEAL|nr:glycosyltransferase family 4 protein [Thermoleophilum album]SEH11650.1 Glycosyl transferase 4-like domain-containing protein [Thermoleophilum album]
MAVRCAFVLPIPVPYREPLFALLAARGRVEPHVVYARARQRTWQQPDAWFPRPRGYQARTLNGVELPRRGPTPLTVPRGLQRTLDEIAPDCVVSSEFGPLTWASIAWCRRRRRPWLVFSEVTEASERVLSAPQRALQRLIARHAAGLLAASGRARRRLLAAGVPPERVAVVLQAADLDAYERVAHVRREPLGRPLRVVSVGRLVPEKRHDLAIEAVARARASLTLEIVGDGPLRRQLEELARRLQAPASLRGFVAPPDQPNVLRQADVFLLASDFEPFGAVVREAAACGLPLVLSERVGAIGDIAVPGRNALVVPAGDPAALANALERLANEPGLLARMSQASIELTRSWPLERDAAALEDAVEAAVAGHVAVARDSQLAG